MLDKLPIPLFATTAIYLPSESAVLICGGEECNINGCEITNRCFKWNGSDVWQEALSLASPRAYHLLAVGPNLDLPGGDEEMTLIATGLYESTEIFSQGLWLPFTKTCPKQMGQLCMLHPG